MPPPWLIAMQRYGPPPSYPNLKVPGLNAPIPDVSTCTVELQSLKHLWNHENMFKTRVVRANECQSKHLVRGHNMDIFSIFFLQLEGMLCVLIRITQPG